MRQRFDGNFNECAIESEGFAKWTLVNIREPVMIRWHLQLLIKEESIDKESEERAPQKKSTKVLIAQRPPLTEVQDDEFRSRFTIEPLEPGFGDTVGNSPRRTLLSSIPGAAGMSIRIECVLHEFSTISEVKEDAPISTR
ncbi:DNA-directed RNA polymerase subunit alpha [Spizellomyces punctatus DAOM BR117]|uniref:DNA-directed RNA polymerase subunit alpha n=1 Tax=Spizellomyces punctatus (strain DAOM BR117) TaxID=645134 RepID=A0A0L0H967_SPIPD|nr:DNA-directed RNA polymerase subunit alpha [Spizellomyces punctatus DAOM BR117]KNC97737.1 DNA-directed RNA polymerase subunit alpha [Spizellomyces punctatus DAOM BR117]|eukprot:XP_016605777.1 DNA-directed RNA polymerase subunit alpha [Spizellomyces punctatus DAOM BR117]